MFGLASSKPDECSSSLSVAEAIGALTLLRRERAKEYKAIQKLDEVLATAQALAEQQDQVVKRQEELAAQRVHLEQEHRQAVEQMETAHQHETEKLRQQYNSQVIALKEAMDRLHQTHDRERQHITAHLVDLAAQEQHAKEQADAAKNRTRLACLEHEQTCQRHQAEIAALKETLAHLRTQISSITSSLQVAAHS